MVVLAITTSTELGSVAVADDKVGLLAQMAWKKPFLHGELAIPIVGDLLKVIKMDISEIDLLAVDNGPGSFTGVRETMEKRRI